MKKFLKLLMAPAAMFLLAGSITSCSPTQVEIAMISDVGDVDDGSFNQGTWQGVKSFSQEHGISCDYYRPFADSDFARECAVKQAVVKGAKIIVLPGFKFTNAALEIANKYPDQHFLLIDSAVSDHPANKNLICVTYDAVFSGWLAGYSVINDYMETDMKNNGKLNDEYKFGFVGGMSNPGVYPQGLGFIQGLLYGARKFPNRPSKPKITIDYNYAGVFIQDDGACARVKGWLGNKTKCVFSCGGKLFQSVNEAIKEYNRHNGYAQFEDQHAPRGAARWIGVDADQYELVQDPNDKKTIYTSGLKDVGKTVKICLQHEFGKIENPETHKPATWENFYNKASEITVTGVKSYHLGLKSEYGVLKNENFVGIPEVYKDNGVMRSFNYFNKTQYENAISLLHGVSAPVQLYSGFTNSEKLTEYGEREGYPTFFKKGASKYPEKVWNTGYYNGCTQSEPEYDNFEINIME